VEKEAAMARTLLGGLILCFSALQARAGINIVSLGTHIYGPKLTLEDLKGHVVVIENWGIN